MTLRFEVPFGEPGETSVGAYGSVQVYEFVIYLTTVLRCTGLRAHQM